MIGFYKSTLIDLFTKVQAIQNEPMRAVEQCYEIQQVLIKKIFYVEKRIQACKLLISNLKSQIASRQTKEKAQEIKLKINQLYQKIDEYKHLLNTLKSIGDALAFTYISSWDIKPMAFKESAGFLSGKKGLQEERRILKVLFDKKIIAMLNDLTHTLRYGDISIFLGDGLFKLIEVKSGSQKEKKHLKQSEKLQKIETYLDTDVVDSLYAEGVKMARVNCHSIEEHHRDLLNDLINQALKSGFAYHEVEPGLAYIVDDARSLDKIKESIQTFGKTGSVPILCMLNSAKYLNGGYYPFILTIKNPNAAYAFFVGEIILMVAIDFNVLADKLASHNLIVEYLNKPDYALKITNTNVDKKFDQIYIANHFFGRLAFEFLSLDWFAEEIIYRVLSKTADEIE